MARSRRCTPITSVTTNASEKQDKRWVNRSTFYLTSTKDALPAISLN